MSQFSQISLDARCKVKAIQAKWDQLSKGKSKRTQLVNMVHFGKVPQTPNQWDLAYLDELGAQ